MLVRVQQSLQAHVPGIISAAAEAAARGISVQQQARVLAR